MSHVVGKGRCPNCAKTGKDRRGDNLAIYSDGHEYCFSCGYYKSGTITQRIKSKLQPEKVESIDIALPEDVIACTYGPGYTWLRQFDITINEILKHRILWYPSQQWVIFPFYDHASIVAWQARNFNPEKKYRYYTKSKVNDILWTMGSSSTGDVVLVEDIVSAIKVGRHTKAMPLLGSVISTNLLLRCKYIANSLTIWLDPDKHSEMVAFSKKAQMFGWKVRTILSDKDPKEYSDAEIIQRIAPDFQSQ